MRRVHQVLSAAGPYDAVTGQAIAWRALLERWGMAGSVYADVVDPRVRDVEPIGRLEPAPGDLVVVHYSAFATGLRRILDLDCRRLLVYHNVTPARYFWNHHPGVAVACELGRSQLPRFVRASHAVAADSAFNADELEAMGAREPLVVPILVEPDRLAHDGHGPRRGDGPLVLCVGRLVPNKRHDLVLAAFAAYKRAHAPGARLLCVGEPLSPSYLRMVERLAERSGAGDVTLATGVPQAQLNRAYAEGDVLLSLSEHEGFCVPLLEALACGLPAVARPVGGMPEVGGDAVLWTDDGPVDVAVAAELLRLAVDDGRLRAELRRRARLQLEKFAPGRVAERIREAVDAALR